MSEARHPWWVWTRSDAVILGAILSLALGLRLVNLNSGLWYDEIVTLVEFVRLPVADLVTTLTALNNHVFFSLQAHASIAVFGESPWALRLPAVLFGVAGVGAVWWLARHAVTSTESHCVALLLAVSYHHVWFSQNARGYTGLMFWSLLGTGLFVRGMAASSRSTWFLYGCVLAAGVYTHLSAGFLFAAHAIVYGIVYLKGAMSQSRTTTLQPLFGFGIGALLVFALNASLFPQILQAVRNVSASPTGGATLTAWKDPLWTALEVLRNVQSLGPLATLGIPLVLLFALIGAVNLSRQHPILTYTFLVHMSLTLASLFALSFRIWPRYFFVDLGFIFLCLVRGVFVFSHGIEGHADRIVPSLTGRRLGLFASLVAVVGSLSLLPANYTYPKQDFEGAVTLIESIHESGDAVASIGLASYAFSEYYAPGWTVVDSWAEIDDLRARSTHLWVVYASPTHTEANYPEVVSALRREFELVKKLPGSLGDGEVNIYRSKVRLESEARKFEEHKSSNAEIVSRWIRTTLNIWS